MSRKKYYDYVMVGAGITNAVIANTIADGQVFGGRTPKILVIDKRNHIAGNCYTEVNHGIVVHKYGAHIFHTSSEWLAKNYLPKFGSWHNYINQPIAITYENGIKRAFNMPFNMNTFAQIYPGCTTPAEVMNAIKNDIVKCKLPTNLEQKAISMVGQKVYSLLINGYTAKQWGKPCAELPPDIISRLPLRFTYDNNYFSDTYQMIPDNGYTEIITNMLSAKGITVMLNTSWDDIKDTIDYGKVFYSGCIDEFHHYKLGALEYRSVKFIEKTYKTENKQGTAVCNYTTLVEPYTRSIEHKWFNPSTDSGKYTIVSYEYPQNWSKKIIPSYPVTTAPNLELYQKYQSLPRDNRVVFVGRLGQYKYLDMDKAILDAYMIGIDNIDTP